MVGSPEYTLYATMVQIYDNIGLPSYPMSLTSDLAEQISPPPRIAWKGQRVLLLVQNSSSRAQASKALHIPTAEILEGPAQRLDQ